MIPGGLFVPGTPEPQGSTRSFVVKGRAVTTSDNPDVKPWRAVISAYIRDSIGPVIVHPTGPVSLGLLFVMPRRKGEPKRITPPHTRRPDADKLVRAVLDALTGLVYTDDSQVVEIHARKRTAEIGEMPGVTIEWGNA